MGGTVHAEGKGFFHKGSNGKGIAQADACLSPPPPPTGPAPVPYVNTIMASNLAKGSKSVKIDGEPTALEDRSYISTSTGDEGGTQGGNVVTHKTKGKGFFKLWSFTVKVEDKGVCRHDDMMAQNCASAPPGCVDMKALAYFCFTEGVDVEKLCDKPYDRDDLKKNGFKDTGNNTDQKAKVRGGPCWECTRDLHKGNWEQIKIGRKVKKKTSAYISGYNRKPDPKKPGHFLPDHFTPDHQPPLSIAWHVGGCHMQPSPDAFIAWADSLQAVKPHCKNHSNSQGGTVGGKANKNMSIKKIRKALLEFLS